MKKFTTILMTCLIMLVVVLTGCSTFRVDKVQYYNEVLAKVGEDKITRFDLINAYNSYGYNTYVSQSGQTVKEALTSTMETLVQRKLVVKYAKDNLDKYLLSQYEVKKLYRDTLDSLLESLADNKATARRIYNLEESETETTNEENTESYKLSEYNYEKRVEVVDGQIKYKNLGVEKDINEIEPSLADNYIINHNDYSQDAIVKQLLHQFEHEFYENTNNEDAETYKKVCDKAIELTCNNLINYEYYLREDGKKLSTNQYDLLYRLVERTYESQLESAYITKVNSVYLANETLSNDSVINAFKALYESDYAKYENNPEAYYEKITSTGSSDAELIYYTPNSDAEFGYFLHVLLPFGDEIEAKLKDLEAKREDLYGDNDELYKAAQMNLVYQIVCAQRTTEEVRDTETGELLHEEGITLEGKVTVQDVLDEYAEDVTDLETFKKFMFKYSTDNATLTADMPYVIGYEIETNDDGEEEVVEYSTMVDNFTNEAIRLMRENQRYTASNEYILTNYGIHLLYYVGPVENQISKQDIGKLTVEKLDSAILNKATGETYLDRVFDLVYPADADGMFTTNTKYSSYEQTLVDSLYTEYPVTLYKTKIKASNKI